MGKKKKKKKDKGVLYDVDKNLDQTYDELMGSIREMQLKLTAADAKAKKRIKKRRKRDPYNAKLYNNDSFRAYTRYQILKEMEDKNLFDRIEDFMKDIVPIVIIGSRLIASLILSILSMDIVKINIRPETLLRLEKIYRTAMAIG